MAISMFRASVPVFLQMLPAMSACLDKAAAYAAAKKIEPSVLLQARLFPDMYPYSRQDSDRDRSRQRRRWLAGQDPPKYEDNETTVDELKARVAKTIDFIKEFKPSQIDGSEERDISLMLGGESRKFKGENYLVGFALPNF